MSENSLIKYLSDKDFNSGVASGVSLVDFFAEWCAPCRSMEPVLDDLAKEMEGKAVVVKVNTDDSQETASKFEVTSIPTLVLLKDGQEVDRAVGVRDLDALKRDGGKSSLSFFIKEFF